MNFRRYLGDGLYGDFDGYQFVLAASNGIVDTNTVYLDPGVLENFQAYIQWVEQIKQDEIAKRNEENG